MSAPFVANPQSLGFKVGRAIGWTAAQTVQRSQQLAEASGDFGRNVAAGTSAQYADTTQSLAAARAAHYAKLAGLELAPKAEVAPAAPAKAPKAAKAAA